MIQPPKNKAEVLERLREVIRHGEYLMEGARYRGAGGRGMFLEDLLGLTTGGADIPDAAGWELKTYTPRTSLVTLFHKEPNPPGIVRDMVSNYGWMDDEGRLSFRHTIRGSSDRFRVEEGEDKFIVRPVNRKSSIDPYWTRNELMLTVGAKLRRLMLVQCQGSGNDRVTYLRVDCFENPELTEFAYYLVRGIIAIDFDAREARPGSDALRNHGTKFRIAPDDVCKMYLNKERIN